MLLFFFIPLFCIAHFSFLRPFDKSPAGSLFRRQIAVVWPHLGSLFPAVCRTGARPLSLSEYIIGE